MTRQTKTPTQRAQEALGIAERRYKKAVENSRRLNQLLGEADYELDQADALWQHAKSHPALQHPTSTTNQEAGTPA